MIKVGIYGSASLDDPVRKQLLRLLLRHPDVELMAVAAPSGNTAPLCELYPVYAGETDLTLERKLNLDGLDVLFVIDEENLTEEILEKYRNDPEFKLIVLGYADHMRATRPSDFTYGLCELDRKEPKARAPKQCSSNWRSSRWQKKRFCYATFPEQWLQTAPHLCMTLVPKPK